MRTFAVYDKTGKITKVISTTRNDVIEKNVPKDHQYMKVDSGVNTNSHQIVNGKVKINRAVKSNILNTLSKLRMRLKK